MYVSTITPCYVPNSQSLNPHQKKDTVGSSHPPVGKKVQHEKSASSSVGQLLINGSTSQACMMARLAIVATSASISRYATQDKTLIKILLIIKCFYSPPNQYAMGTTRSLKLDEEVVAIGEPADSSSSTRYRRVALVLTLVAAVGE